MTMRKDNQPDYNINSLTEVLNDILDRLNPAAFNGIKFYMDHGTPVLNYTVGLTGTEIRKEFEPDQGIPELKADVIEFMFSMLDYAAAN